ncbi:MULTISPECIES: glycosyltransferase family 9 protein [unclassified Lentimonas]|uniref:LpxL/LpxP family acyltransferase n=1 Tax=unclassified Lentimonas TaxID=2630993 RepID=UPI0013898C96|nr:MULTISPECIES: glycosyltransferase family 9 protein [unclassified Lentimonas]
MALFFIKLLGRLSAASPVWLMRCLCVLLGRIVGICAGERGHITRKNLHHAFSEKTEQWRRRVYYEACARVVEMALFMPASRYFSASRIDSVLEVDAEVRAAVERYISGDKQGKPFVVMLPHMTMSEAASLLPHYFPGLPQVNVVFRPLNQPAMNAWVEETRSRFGNRQLSRRSGYNDAMAALRRGEGVALLFDQDAAGRGATSLFMGRLASLTDLPGLMALRFDADVHLLLLERTEFWQAKLTLQQLPKCETSTEIAVRAHNLLEAYLKRDDHSAPDWLWLHGRWGHQSGSKKRFNLPEKRMELEQTNTINGEADTPRKTRLWVRMPNWLGDVVMALPLLRAIRKARPDFEITLIGKAAFQPLFDRLDVGDRFIPLPKQGRGYFKAFYQLRHDYPDTYLLFTNSTRSDLEAFLTRCPQRMGMIRPGKKRQLLTKPYYLPADIDETTTHQTAVWEMMLERYGLRAPLDCAPLPREAPSGRPQVAMICGTENAPEKRWPISHWRALIEQLLVAQPEVEVLLFGTPADRAITDQVAEGLPAGSIQNLAGKTNLAEFCDGLKQCNAVICNDTGGMHLANMMGTPVVVVFGPTNPVRTGPIFDAPKHILQPEGCPETGGFAIEGVSAERVLASVLPYVGGAAE